MRMRFIAGALVTLLGATTLAACGQAQTASSPTPATEPITVLLTDTTVTASQVTLHLGVRYHFIVTNKGTVSHQFWLMPQGMAQMMGQMPMAQWHQRILYSSQDIGPSMMTAFDYTFTMPMMQQPLAFGCYATGYPLMQLPITVRP